MWLDDQHIDFTFLQETHCVRGREKLPFSSWSGKSFQSNSNNPRSRGVAILVGKKTRYKILNSYSDNDGRLVMINVEIYNDILSLVSLYAPNDPGTQEEFFKYAWKWINKHTLNETNLLIAGDFNNYLRQCDITTDTLGNLLDRGHF